MSQYCDDKIHVVSFSGGRSSALLVYLMEIKRKKENWNVHFIFMDTGFEHTQTYDFIRNMVKHWGIKLTVIRVVVNPTFGIGVTYKEISLDEMKCDLKPWKEMVSKYGLPTIQTPRCTSRLKSEPHDKFCDAKWGRGNYITWLGIRCDEPNRLKHFQANIDMFDDKKVTRPIRYLAELSPLGKAGVIDWWKDQLFDLGIPDYLGNCVFCVKKSEAKLWAAAKVEPELAEEFKEMIMSDDVRELPNQPFKQGVIYRGHISIEDVIKLSKVLPLKELEETMEETAYFELDEPSFCSESCEVFPDEYTNDVDTFELEMQVDGRAA